jgi:hypothetical protein
MLGCLIVLLTSHNQGGIVFDSDPYDEWIETINKLGKLSFSAETTFHVERLLTRRVGANTQCIIAAEKLHLEEQKEMGHADASSATKSDGKTHNSLAA